MQKVQLDEKAEKMLDELVRDWELDEKWKLEGKLEGKLEIALKMLSKGMSLEEVADITELPLDKLKINLR